MATAAQEIAALRGTRPATLKDLFGTPSFSRLWRAMLVSSLGDWVGFVAVASLVARLGGRDLAGLAVAGVMLARLLPSVLFGPIAGVLTDRLDRRKVMISADIARGLLYASMPFMPGLWAIFLLTFFIECLSLLWTPAKDASVPNLVPRRQLSNANSIGLVMTYGTMPLGATIYTALAGVSVGIGSRFRYFDLHPESLPLWLDALSFLFSAWMVRGLHLPPRAGGRNGMGGSTPLTLRSTVAELREGIAFIRKNLLVRALTIGIVVAAVGAGSVMSLGPVFARYSVQAGSTGFGVLMIALGIGMGIGFGGVNVLTRHLEKDRIFYAALLAAGLALIAVATSPSIALAATFTVALGLAVGLGWVAGYTLLQENVSDEFRGRTFATLTTMVRLALFFSLAAFPAIQAAIGNPMFDIGRWQLALSGTRIALWLGGAIALAAAVIAATGLRRIRLARPRPLTLVPRLRKVERLGTFIVFEGVEGSGKGTQIELARRYLESGGREVVVTREPGGTGLGDRLREALLDASAGHMEARAEALLFAAVRAQHVADLIRPALEEGKVVLCDRFIDSSLAYQGVARGLGEQDVLNLNVWATQGLFPDLVILLNLDPERGLARVRGEPDRIEAEQLGFHATVAEAYLKIAEEHPERFKVLDADVTPEALHEQVRAAIDALFEKE